MHPRVVPVKTTGSAGVAAGSADAYAVTGQLLDSVALDYAGTAPATTVVTISFPDMPGTPNVVYPASNTDKVWRPRVPVQLASAPTADLSGRAEEKLLVYGRVNVAAASSDALDPAVTARLYFA